MSNATTKQDDTLHTGSCHCGHVRFEAQVDLAKASKCNCTICQKLGAVGTLIKPAAFRLLTDKSQLFGYTGKNGVGERFFCKTCGIYCFGTGHLEMLGGDFVSININALDDVEHSAIQPGHHDGRHDNWMAGMRPSPWPTFAGEEAKAGAAG